MEVGLNDLFQAEQHQYQYKIRELGDEWLDIPGNRLRVHGLSFGNHVLEIQAKNARGVESANVLSIPIRVVRPFYQRWWFIVGMALGIMLIIREYWMARMRGMRRQARKLERLVSERTTKIKEQADDLKRLQEARSKFFANISHELRTPLTLIKGPVEGLMNKGKTEEEEQHYLKIINYNAHLLGERIEDLLMLARSDSGNLEVHRTPVRFNRFLERIVDSFKGLAQERRFDLVINNALPANAVIMTDSRKLEHILSNFLSNALKYANPDSRITVSATPREDELIVSVADEGPGIAPELLEKVFERFYVGGEKTQGAGIGLALSRDLARVMQGKVWVESEPGTGSTFFVAIPYEAAEETTDEQPELVAPVRPAAQDSGQSGRQNAHRILCVEDNRSMRDYILTELKDFQVTTCGNGAEALERLEEMAKNSSLPDVVLSDVMMPVMDGFELARNLRSSSRFSSIPIILLTARTSQQDKLAGLRIGVDDYVTKPFNTEELRIRIDQLVGRKHVRQETVGEDGEQQVTINEKWLMEVQERMLARLHQRDFTIDDLADEMHLSRSQFYRRIKAYTGLTPHKYLREARLYKAKELLESAEVPSIAQLSASVGFEDAGYFSRIFRERFGFSPAERL